MADIATLGIKVESGQVVKSASDLDKLTASAKKTDAQVNALSNTTHQHSAAAAKNAVALNGQAMAMNKMAVSSKMAAMNQRMMLFQLNDIGVSLAGGMNPLLVMVQQGSQITQMYAGQGGVNQAIADTGKIFKGAANSALGFARAHPLILAGVAAVAGGLKVLQHEINASSDVTVTMGDTVLAIFQTIRDSIANFLAPAFNMISEAASAAYEAIKGPAKTAINTVIRLFVMGGASIKHAFLTSFDAIKIAFLGLANSMGSTMTRLINEGIIKQINQLISFANNIPGVDIGTFGQVSNEQISGALSTAQRNAALRQASFQNTVGGIGQTDYLGQFFDAVSSRAIENANNRLEDTASKVRDVGKAAKDSMKPVKEVVDGLSEMGQFASGIFKGFVNDLRNGASVADAFKNVLNKLLDKLIETASNQLAMGLFGGNQGGGGLLGGLFGGLLGGSSFAPGATGMAGLPMYEQGTPYVPKTGMAMLHKGEAVIPAKFNNGGMGGSGTNVVVNNNAPKTEASARTAPDGTIEVIVEAVKQDMARGGFDRIQGARFGAKPVARMGGR